MTNKQADFELFKQAVELIERGEHLTCDGLRKLVAIKASMNKGLTAELKDSFPNIVISRPAVKNIEIKHPEWIVGFTEAEGCFFVAIKKSPKSKLGEAVWLRFMITQHSRDEKLING